MTLPYILLETEMFRADSLGFADERIMNMFIMQVCAKIIAEVKKRCKNVKTRFMINNDKSNLAKAQSL